MVSEAHFPTNIGSSKGTSINLFGVGLYRDSINILYWIPKIRAPESVVAVSFWARIVFLIFLSEVVMPSFAHNALREIRRTFLVCLVIIKFQYRSRWSTNDFILVNISLKCKLHFILGSDSCFFHSGSPSKIFCKAIHSFEYFAISVYYFLQISKRKTMKEHNTFNQNQDWNRNTNGNFGRECEIMYPEIQILIKQKKK